MKLVASSRLRFIGALLLAVTLVVAAAVTATSRAGSNFNPTAKVTLSPHVLTVGKQGFLSIKFINPGPSTVNHALATVTDKNNTGVGLPLPASAFPLSSIPSDCLVSGTTTSLITCNFGQVPPGTVRRTIPFNAVTVTSFTAHIAVSFDEGKGTQLTDTSVNNDFPFFIVASSTQSRGQCTTDLTAQTLTASDAAQQTSITYPRLSSLLFPCTPASAGLDGNPGHQPLNVPSHFGEISYVDVLDGGALVPVKVIFLSTPQGVTKKNLALYELANFSPAGDLDLYRTATNNGAPVPNCNANLQIPPQYLSLGYVSCLVTVDNFPGGGLVATLMARGGNDSGWGGAG